MTPGISLRPEAEAELAEAIDWYETRGTGLGAEFLRAVEAAVANVARNPLAYPVIENEIRRAPVRRFPYSLMYSANQDEIVIVACFHGRRDPKLWKARTTFP
jgi:plasmid stabilization system protein ParE